MLPFFWRDTTNFGDYMNKWLWPKIIPDLLEPNDGIRLIGIGSLLKSDLTYVQGKKVIFGTGSGYGNIPPQAAIRDWSFYCVRGPLTAKAFCLNPDKSIVDSAWLISQVKDFSQIPTKKNGVIFIPHWATDAIGNWEKVCQFSQIEHIDPRSDFENIIKKIAESELVITESLHGAILADYYRTPWIPVQIAPNFLRFKWYDWCLSINLNFRAIILPPSDFIESLYYKINPFKLNYNLIYLDAVSNFLYTETNNKIIPLKIYKGIASLKQYLKIFKKKALQNLKNSRDSIIFNKWNSTHLIGMEKILKEVCKEKSFLSDIAIRNEKIEKLEACLTKLKTDYNTGVLF